MLDIYIMINKPELYNGKNRLQLYLIYTQNGRCKVY